MAVYYINFLLILGLAYPLCIYKPSKVKSIAYLAVTFGWMWFIASFRYGIGFDFDSYIRIFETVRESPGFSALLPDFAVGQNDALWEVRYEIGFVLLTKIMTLFINNTTVMYGVYQVLILGPVVWFIYRHCKNIWLPTFLYVSLTFFYLTMNFTRQSLAASICLLGYGYLKQRRHLGYCIIILLAASFHVTALIMLPIYLLSLVDLNKKTAIIYSALVITTYVSSSFIIDFVTRFIFTFYRDSIWLTQSLGAQYLFVPFAIVLTCIVLLPGWKKREPAAGQLTNMMIFSATIWLFSTRHFILERFSVYPYLLLLLALPSSIATLKASDEEYATLVSAKSEGKTGGGKKKLKPAKEPQNRKSADLAKSVREREVYYWSAVTAVIIVAFIYHSLGVSMGFHNVFPYSSVIPWLN